MYQVLCDNNLLFDHGVDDLKIINPRLTLEVNKVGRFDFTIYPTHPLYGLIHKLKSVIEVYQDGVLLFRGRPLNDTMRFDKSKDIICEGDLAFFNDTIMRPYNFTGSISDFLQSIITSHNAQVESNKQFTLGNVNVTDPNNLIVRSSISHDKSWSVINDKLIGILGGYIILRRQSNINYIDYLSDSPYQSLQTIELGKNLLDVIRETRSDDIITALIPLGAKLTDENGNETDQRLNIVSVNGGLDYVHDVAAVTQYGWIFGTKTWDDVTDANNLLTRANQELAVRINLGVSVELKAIDLSMVKEPELWGRNLIQKDKLSLGVTTTEEFVLSGWANDLMSNTNVKQILIPGKTYTISFDMELTQRTSVPTLYGYQCGLLLYSQATTNDVTFFNTVLRNVGDTTRMVVTFTCQPLTDQRLIFYTNRYTTNGGSPIGYDTVKFSNLKLEEGNIAHKWTPAPEDVPSTDEIRVFEYVNVKSEPHGIDTMALITKLTIDLLQPNNNTVTFGFDYESFTDKQFQSEQAIRIIESDYVRNETVTEVKNTLTTLSSNIEQTAEQLRQEVAENYVETGAFTQYQSQVSTQFTQTSTDFTFLFQTLEQVVQTLDGATQAQFAEFIKYIRFVDGTIELGEVNNPIKLVLQNNRISFTQNGAEVAYITDNTLYITDGRFLNSLRIGNFAFTPRSNGSLSFGKVV